MNELTLTSPVFEHDGFIPKKYTCDGEDISPQLEISNVSPDAKSLVLIMDDPDVPKHLRENGIWDHWIVFNIPTDTEVIGEGKKPLGIRGLGTANNLDYHGPCPPNEEHRYFFSLYSLDIELELNEGVGKEVVKSAMKGHILQKVELMGRYNRS